MGNKSRPRRPAILLRKLIHCFFQFNAIGNGISDIRSVIEILKKPPLVCHCNAQKLYRENEIGQFRKQRSLVLAKIAQESMSQQCPYLERMEAKNIPDSDLVPYQYKAPRLIEFGRKYAINVMVETGTWQGSTTFECFPHFKRQYTIELSHDLWAALQPAMKQRPSIKSLEGDSSVVLRDQVLPELDEPTIFWLDGHYSSTGTARGNVDSPIFYELTHILQHSLASKFIIIIDDMRLFKGYVPECQKYHSDQVQCYPSIHEIGEIFCAFQTNHRMSIQVTQDAIIAIGGDLKIINV